MLKARLSFCCVGTLNTIAALGWGAAVCAGIGSNGVVVIALLLWINDAIAADLHTAIGPAVITNVGIAVVTGFETFI